MQILQFTDVDQIFRLYKRAEEFEMGGGVSFSRREVEIFLLGSVAEHIVEDQNSKLVVLKPVHQHLLIALVALIVEDQHSAQGVKNATFLKIVVQV
jgi:hypothetical protein